MKQRHRNWYLRLAEHAQPYLQGPEGPTWVERLQVEQGDLRVNPESGVKTVKFEGAQCGRKCA